MDAAIIALGIMLCMHGFFLDIVIIGILPFLSEAKGDASRAALFPWCSPRGGAPQSCAQAAKEPSPVCPRLVSHGVRLAALTGAGRARGGRPWQRSGRCSS